MLTILRAPIFHTPAAALVSFEDGAIAIDNGRIVACSDYSEIRRIHPDAPVRDLRGGYILPGFIDTHIHFPQVRVIGGLGYSLLDWLDRLTLPEEARLADVGYAAAIAREFVQGLISHGTTTALVFGAHFPSAMEAFFESADRVGVRVISGLALADRMLRPELHITPDEAYQRSRELIRRFHNKRRLAYAVTPRFALSASEPILDVCKTLLREDPSLRFTTHINENPLEIEAVAKLFPGATDYFDVYDRFHLVGRRSVLAHNVHATDSELQRIAARQASIAHCPCSNAALGSGIFPMRRHLAAGVKFALGTDVGGGTGFGVLKEALQSYLLQRVAPEPLSLTPARMLFLATRAGAEALNLEDETGDFEPGKAADLVYLRPPENSPLQAVLRGAGEPERVLAAILTLAGPESIREVYVEGDLVHANRS